MLKEREWVWVTGRTELQVEFGEEGWKSNQGASTAQGSEEKEWIALRLLE